MNPKTFKTFAKKLQKCRKRCGRNLKMWVWRIGCEVRRVWGDVYGDGQEKIQN